MLKPEFSVIIPARRVDSYLRENLDWLKKQNESVFEAVVVLENPVEEKKISEYEFEKTILYSNGGPSEKRNLAAKYSRGQWLAFIDSDAFPNENWLKTGKKYLVDEKVAALGGPQVTPPEDSFWQKVSGAAFLSPLSGRAIIRFLPGKKSRSIDDWPTVNFIVKKKDFEAVGGFDSDFWPGEDTKLCLDIVDKLKKKILYVPEMIVYHHRRSGLKKHLEQTGNYGLCRGFFAKKFPKTSARFIDFYFVPSLWVAYLALGPVVFLFLPIFWKFYLFGICFYLSVVILSIFPVWYLTGNFLISLLSLYYLILFHIWYGIRFIQGYVFTKNLRSKPGRSISL